SVLGDSKLHLGRTIPRGCLQTVSSPAATACPTGWIAVSVMASFLRRDWLAWTSYRLALVWQVVGMTIAVIFMYFIGSAVGGDPRFQGQGRTYFAFALAGLSFTDTFLTSLNALPQAVRDGQVSGTLEPILL